MGERVLSVVGDEEDGPDMTRRPEPIVIRASDQAGAADGDALGKMLWLWEDGSATPVRLAFHALDGDQVKQHGAGVYMTIAAKPGADELLQDVCLFLNEQAKITLHSALEQNIEIIRQRRALAVAMQPAPWWRRILGWIFGG